MPEQKDATKFTEAANNGLLTELNWDDTQDCSGPALCSNIPVCILHS